MKAPWYHFWNPNSGAVGGVIAGAVLAVAQVAIAWLVWS